MDFDGGTSHFISAQDGLKLHLRIYGRRSATTCPVLCLPGLTRTTMDFSTLAHGLSADPVHPRYVVAMDSRGRGLSDYDRNPANYNVATELSDLLAVLTALEITSAVFVGTSRGGILSMLLGSARPSTIAGVVLNDIGPVIEPLGLARIKSYVGKLPQPRTFEEAADILQRLFGGQFPRLKPADWMAHARRTYKEQKGRLVPTYDVRIAATLQNIDLERPLPPLWKDFDALGHAPIMVIRGLNSDLLAESTVVAMKERRPDLEVVEVPDQGHAPLLMEDEYIRRIGAFVCTCNQ